MCKNTQGQLHWPEGTPWGGWDYSTCLALRLLREARVEEVDALVEPARVYSPLRMSRWERLLVALRLRRPGRDLLAARPRRQRIEAPFWKGLNGLVARMLHGRLYSTAATREYAELLAEMRLDWPPPTLRFLDDGRGPRAVEVSFDTGGRPFQVVSGRAILVQEAYQPSGQENGRDVQVSAVVPARAVRLEESFPVQVSFDAPGMPITTPVLRLQVPAHLHLQRTGMPLTDGRPWQEIPLRDQRKIDLSFCAVRRGRGTVTFQVVDMYDRAISGACQRVVQVR